MMYTVEQIEDILRNPGKVQKANHFDSIVRQLLEENNRLNNDEYKWKTSYYEGKKEFERLKKFEQDIVSVVGYRGPSAW